MESLLMDLSLKVTEEQQKQKANPGNPGNAKTATPLTDPSSADPQKIRELEERCRRLSASKHDLEQQNAILTDERNRMEAMVKSKSKRIQEIKEERGIALGEMKILLETVQEEKRGLQNQRDEERDVITTNLRHTIDQLLAENQKLRKRLGEPTTAPAPAKGKSESW